ncbi:MAG: hypothetical protein ACE5G9_12975 [Nitrospinales bacterium]
MPRLHMMWVVLLLTLPASPASAVSADPGLPAVSTTGKEYPLLPLEQFKHAGPIVASLDDLGSIVGNPNQRTIMGVGDKVYINMGTEQSVAAGDRFSIVTANRVVYPPSSTDDAPYQLGAETWESYLTSIRNKIPFLRKPLGVIVLNLGTLDVVKSEKNVSEAVIRESFGPIRNGARLLPYQEPVAPQLARDYKPSAKDIQGHIVAFREEKTVAGMKDIVYIDKGEAGNVAAGDRFEIYAIKQVSQQNAWYDEFSEVRQIAWVIGELQVIATQQETSMAVIRKNVQEILVGHRVRYVPRPAVNPR